VIIVLREDGGVVCGCCALAATPLRRMKGLLGRSELAAGEGMLLRPATSIHTLFMRFPIDAVFLDRNLVVRKVVVNVKPWRLVFARHARSVLELAAGEAARREVVAGQQLIVRD
jgi:uncharacterized protein